MRNIPKKLAKYVKHEVFKLAGEIEGGGEINGINGTITLHDVARVVRFMHLDKDDVVLDVGSGTGLACLNIANEAGCQVIGMEWLASLHEKTMHVHNLMHKTHQRDYAPPIIPIGGPIQGNFRFKGMKVCKYVTAMYSFWDSNSDLYDDHDSANKEEDGLGIVETFFRSPTVKCVALIARKRTNDKARNTLFHLIQEEIKRPDDETWTYMQEHFEWKYMTNKDSGREESKNPEELVPVNMYGGGNAMKCFIIRRKRVVEKPLPIDKLIKDLGLREIPRQDISQKSTEKQAQAKQSTSNSSPREESISAKQSTSNSSPREESISATDVFVPRKKDQMRIEKTKLTADDEFVELEFGKIISHLKSASFGTRPEDHMKRANTLIGKLMKSFGRG